MSVTTATIRYSRWRGSFSERALVADVPLLWPDLLQERPLVIYGAVLRRVRPAPALRCAKVPFARSAPAQLHKMAASTRAQPICLKLSATASLSLWIHRRAIELSAHRSSAFARAGRLLFSAACRQYA
jgi:hypothetical protein